jgi:prepilin-type processing-associated H-X9-DG protein
VEVLVGLGILAVLLSLILPAIANSRRAADSMQCRARMSQIGRAVQNFEARQRRYPRQNGEVEWHFEVLPDLDRADLFHQMEGHENDSWTLDSIMQTTSVPVFQCPSDSRIAPWNSAINFVRNGGSMFDAYELPDEGNDQSHGMTFGVNSSADVTDGLSMTAFLSEQMNVFRRNSTDRRARWTTPTSYPQPDQLDLFADLCESMPAGAIGLPDNDDFPLSFTNGYTRYDHIARPNHTSCRNQNLDSRFMAFTANSLHSGGVNVLMADGAVRFVSNNVTRRVWRGMGTRNGHETITLP